MVICFVVDWIRLRLLWLVLRFRKGKPRDTGIIILPGTEQSGMVVDVEGKKEDWVVSFPEPEPVLRSDVDLADEYSYVQNQLTQESCLAFAGCRAIEALYEVTGVKVPGKVSLSERDLFYSLRKKYGNFPKNQGVTMSILMDVMKNTGTCPETLSPYVLSDINKDPDLFSKGFRLWKIGSYYRLLSYDDLVESLKNKMPVIAGIFRNKSFNDFINHDAWYDKEEKVNKSVGHSILIIKISDIWGIRYVNSWGNNYKDNGLGWMSREYYEKLCYDARAVSLDG